MKIKEGLKSNLIELQKNSIIKLPESFVNLFKSGGNLKIKLKSGNKIHIKKKNRGKFTDYCGGKVTSECIARGKNSPNPTIRKRATFAANVRKWKHEDGGSMRIPGVLDSNPKLNNMKGNYVSKKKRKK